MGLSLGGTQQQSQASSTGSQANTYGAGQGGIQQMLGQFFSTLIPSMTSGSLSPATQAQTTSNANQINQNYSTVGNTLQSQLAARGLSGSGQSGETTLQTDLAQQGAQAANISAGGASQLSQNNTDLLDALNYAFTSLGSSASSSGTGSGSSSGWGASLGGAAGSNGAGGVAMALGA